MPGTDPKVLYLVISGAPAPEGLPSLVSMLQAAGWRVVVFSTPMGTRWLALEVLMTDEMALEDATLQEHLILLQDKVEAKVRAAA